MKKYEEHKKKKQDTNEDVNEMSRKNKSERLSINELDNPSGVTKCDENSLRQKGKD